MNLTLYHGSDHIIETPVYGHGRLHNDYGRGFYCTECDELAKEWAVGEHRDGFINCYSLDTAELITLNLNDNLFTPIHWLNILLQNRIFDILTPLEREAKKYISENYAVPVEQADLVIGYRADDSYFSYARDFIGGVISYEQLAKALKLGNLGIQICIKSERAFRKLKYVGSEKVLSEEWYPKKILRDRNARAGYRDMEKEEYHKGELYISRMIDEEMKADDLRIR